MLAAMLVLVASVLAVTQAPSAPGPAAPRVQALATVRIVKGEAIRFGEARDGENPAPLHQVRIVLPDGSTQPAKVVEFE